MVELWKVVNGELVRVDCGPEAKAEEYGRQGFFCIYKEPTETKMEEQKVAA